MKLVCISDTHGDHEQVSLPDGDVLIHAGDITGHGTEKDFLDFLTWFNSQPHAHKLFVAGNHDRYLEDIGKHWAEIPKDTDVLITHGPPHGILDHVKRLDGSEEQTGCPQLLDVVLNLQPKLHVFGHIHEEYGVIKREGIEFLNVSTMNQSYRIANAPVVYELS